MKKYLSILLISVMIVSFVGCGKDGEEVSTEGEQSYQSSFKQVDIVPENVSDFQLSNDRIWFLSGEESFIGSMAIDGSDLKEINLSKDDSIAYNIFDIASDESITVGGINNETNIFTLVKLNKDGTEEFRTEFENDIRYMSSDGENNIYLTEEDKVIVLNPQGEKLFDLPAERPRISADSQGNIWVSTFGDSGYEFKSIDVNNKDYGKEKIVSEEDFRNIVKGNDIYSFFIISSDIVRGYNSNTNKFEDIFSFSDVDIVGNYVKLFASLEEDKFICLTKKGKDVEVANILKGEKGTEKTTLTLASFVLMPHIEERIVEFNRTNLDYRIEVLDYSKYNTPDDYSAGETKLNTDIVAGNTPDIIELGKTPLEVYTNKGLLEDLNKFLQSDETISKDDLVLGAFNALSTEDGLYRLSPHFSVTTLYGKESKIGDKTSWNLEGLQKFLDSNEDIVQPFINMPPSQILNSLTMYTMDQFVDAESGECSFDSPEFITLLELVKKFSEDGPVGYKEPNKELLENKGLLATMYMGTAKHFAKADNELNGDLKIIGFPTEEGSGSVADFQFSFGIFSDSKHKDGAWQFLRTLLEEDYQDNIAEFETPVLLSSYNKMLDKAEIIEEQKEEYNKIINAVTKTSSYDGTLMGIISEEANAFFEGERSAEEVAEAIQSRARIYISEKR
ncbi:extracellular solute-binding protein [Clostridiisalibacter paucivorans]|uniref:extracellular solute-binding protein n=1 Tax=Clostridiisalibacter paucivorans TaxID=408753 RepID=UPI00047DD700|nr:extracellular solute-binding protein [Clostridiisalibacter paucivorans]